MVSVYWRTCVPFNDYVEQEDRVKKHCLATIGCNYIPEFLYFKDKIAPEYLTLITE